MYKIKSVFRLLHIYCLVLKIVMKVAVAAKLAFKLRPQIWNQIPSSL